MLSKERQRYVYTLRIHVRKKLTKRILTHTHITVFQEQFVKDYQSTTTICILIEDPLTKDANQTHIHTYAHHPVSGTFVKVKQERQRYVFSLRIHLRKMLTKLIFTHTHITLFQEHL